MNSKIIRITTWISDRVCERSMTAQNHGSAPDLQGSLRMCAHFGDLRLFGRGADRCLGRGSEVVAGSLTAWQSQGPRLRPQGAHSDSRAVRVVMS